MGTSTDSTATSAKKHTITAKIGKLFGSSKNGVSQSTPDVGVKQVHIPSPSSSTLSSASSTTDLNLTPELSRPNSPPLSLNGRTNVNGVTQDGNSVHTSKSLTDSIGKMSSTSLSSMSGSGLPVARFVLHEDGSHEHHLKNAKRQEKISSMIKNMLGAQKLRGEAKSAVPDILMNTRNQQHLGGPPSLFSGFMKQVATMDPDAPYSGASQNQMNYFSNVSPADLKGNTLAPMKKDLLCFAQKYGRCQEVVGKGAFGVVRICHKKSQDVPSGEKLYAVKEFRRKPSESPEKYSRRLTSEFCISSSLRHTNIIMTLDLFQDAKGDYCQVMEYCFGGDLFTLIISAGKLEYIEADCFFKQLIRGVVYMHEMGVCHRDLKPENVLLTSTGVLKITDFGNSECFRMAWEKDIHLSGGVCGSSPYIAPEEYTHDEFDPRPVDIWACGVIYMAMRTGRQLWSTAQKEDEYFAKYLKGRKDEAGYEPIELLKRARCRNVIYSILDPVPGRRINGPQILNSEWGREIKCCHDGHALK